MLLLYYIKRKRETGVCYRNVKIQDEEEDVSSYWKI